MPRIAPVLFTFVGVLGVAGCGLLTGLDSLQEVECVGVCLDGDFTSDGDSDSSLTDDTTGDSGLPDAPSDDADATADVGDGVAYGSPDGPTEAPEAADADSSASGMQPDTGTQPDSGVTMQPDTGVITDASRDVGPPP